MTGRPSHATARALARDAALLAGAYAAAAGVAAATLALAASALGKHPASGLAYPPASGRARDALAITAGNARVAALLLGAALIAPALPRPGRPVVAMVLAAIAAANAARIGALIAYDGPRALTALAPYTPVELLALSLPAALYAHAWRHGPIGARLALGVAATTGLLLAGAAALEVMPT